MAAIWTGMVVISILCGLATGNGAAVGAAALEGAGAAVDLCLAMAGVLCLWMGVMEIMKRSGLSAGLSKLLRPLLGIPGSTGVAFISSFTGSDVAAVMTRDLYESGSITDDERTIFVAYQYAGSACINNTITGGAPLLAICPVSLGAVIVIEFFCKLIGANVVRLILFFRSKKRAGKE